MSYASRKYHGWIVKQESPGYNPTWRVEYIEDETRKSVRVSSAAEAIEFFDKRTGATVLLLDTPLGACRVYTEIE